MKSQTQTSPPVARGRRKPQATPQPASPETAAKLEEAVLLPPYTGLGRLLRNAHIAFNRLFTLNLSERSMTFGQFQHLQSLWPSDGITQVELAERIGIRPAASTAILLSLEKSGHIRRVRNSADRRKISVYLTPKGNAVKADLLKCASQTNAVACEDLSEKNIADLNLIVGRIMASLATATDEFAASRNGREPAPRRRGRSRAS